MLSAGMYVRCPADKENMAEPRVFICGQITKVDEFKKTVVIKIHDPFDYLLFFEDLPKGTIELPQGNVDRCNFFMESTVVMIVKDAKFFLFKKQKMDITIIIFKIRITNKLSRLVKEK